MGLNIEDGAKVRIVTKTGEVQAPVEYTYQAVRGYVLVPHQYGLEFDKKTYGMGINTVTSTQDLDELTGNSLYRYVPCRLEKIS